MPWHISTMKASKEREENVHFQSTKNSFSPNIPRRSLLAWRVTYIYFWYPLDLLKRTQYICKTWNDLNDPSTQQMTIESMQIQLIEVHARTRSMLIGAFHKRFVVTIVRTYFMLSWLRSMMSISHIFEYTTFNPSEFSHSYKIISTSYYHLRFFFIT